MRTLNSEATFTPTSDVLFRLDVGCVAFQFQLVRPVVCHNWTLR